jgi:outer membrane lipoprotein-sorting protein
MEANVRFSVSRTAVLTVLLGLAAGAAQAQTVDEIVARNIEAKGGAALLAATTSVRTVGKGTMQGAQVSVSSASKRPSFFRNEMEMGGQKLVQGFDGSTLWMAAGNSPAQALPPGPQTESLKQSSQIDSPLLNYKEKGTKIELGDPAAEGGRRLHHLIVRPKTGPAMHYYIDAATNLEAKMVIDVEDNGQKMKMEMRFSNFKQIDGRTVPLTVSQFVNGQEVGQMQFEKVEFNVPLDESIFRMPK